MLKPHPKHLEYLVSTEGYVLNKKQTAPLKPSFNTKGYAIINLHEHGKITGIAIHRMVAETFIPNPENKPQINHIDGNKTNNSVNNLEWVTQSENMKHATLTLNQRIGKNNPKAKRIKGINTKTNQIIEFDSLMDATRFLFPNENYDTIRQKCHSIWRSATKRRKTAFGYTWHYI